MDAKNVLCLQFLLLLGCCNFVEGQLRCPPSYRCYPGYTCAMVRSGRGRLEPECMTYSRARLIAGEMHGRYRRPDTGFMQSRLNPYYRSRFLSDSLNQYPGFQEPFAGGLWDPNGIRRPYQGLGGAAPIVDPNIIGSQSGTQPNIVKDNSRQRQQNLNIVNNNNNVHDQSNSGSVQVNQQTSHDATSGQAPDTPIVPIPEPHFDPAFDPGMLPVVPLDVDLGHGPGIHHGIELGPAKPQVM